jgi:hypothetical protein
MTFTQFLEKKNNKDCNYYLLQSNVDLKKLNVNTPSFLVNENKKNYALWINFGNNIYSGLHYDIHNNILLQLKGKKRIFLFPPSERQNLHLVNKINPTLLCQMKNLI